MPRKKKADAAGETKKAPPPMTADEAREQVRKWILTGASEHDVRAAIAKAWPDADARALVLQVFDDLADATRRPLDVLKGFVFEAYRELYRRMVECGDFPGALRAAKALDELAGELKAAEPVQKPRIFRRAQ